YGVLGNSTSFAGVNGSSSTAQGVVGSSSQSVGVLGGSTSSNGVQGSSNSGNGVYGTTTGSGRAAQFDGPVVINGSLSVSGIKSAVVRHPDGKDRRLYCLESPESWFEDFGLGRLQNGSGHVDLDNEFAAVVHTQNYHVYLTPRGDSKGLYIAS